MDSGEEELSTKKHELRMQLDEISKKIHTLRDQKSRILDQIGDRVAELPHKEGMKLLAEIDDLERDKPKVSDFNMNDEEMDGLDPGLTDGLLKHEKKGHFCCLRSVDF